MSLDVHTATTVVGAAGSSACVRDDEKLFALLHCGTDATNAARTISSSFILEVDIGSGFSFERVREEVESRDGWRC